MAVVQFAPLSPPFGVGECLSGYWSDTANQTSLTSTDCARPHDYRVIAIADDWATCPAGTFGHVPFAPSRFGGIGHYMCITRAS